MTIHNDARAWAPGRGESSVSGQKARKPSKGLDQSFGTAWVSQERLGPQPLRGIPRRTMTGLQTSLRIPEQKSEVQPGAHIQGHRASVQKKSVGVREPPKVSGAPTRGLAGLRELAGPGKRAKAQQDVGLTGTMAVAASR